MERLWAPWRMRYIEGLAQPSDCFLCDYPTLDPSRDSDTFILHRSKHGFVILNLFPYNLGHLVIAPYVHEGSFESLSPETHADLAVLVSRSLRALTDEYGPQGFNVGMNLGQVAGAGVPDHLHQHVVPRWSGDANFMTTVAETKSLPESLVQTYARLRPRFDA